MTNKLVEKVARALDRHALRERGWTEDAIRRAQETVATPSAFALGEARVAIAACVGPGEFVGPREVTEEMADAAMQANEDLQVQGGPTFQDYWRVMIAAHERAEKEKDGG